MRSEDEIQQLYDRLKRAIRFGAELGAQRAELKKLVAHAMDLEWVLERDNKPTAETFAALHKTLSNLEGLQASYENSRKAGQN